MREHLKRYSLQFLNFRLLTKNLFALVFSFKIVKITFQHFSFYIEKCKMGFLQLLISTQPNLYPENRVILQGIGESIRRSNFSYYATAVRFFAVNAMLKIK